MRHYAIWHRYENRRTLLDYAFSLKQARDIVRKLNLTVKEGEASQYFYRKCGC